MIFRLNRMNYQFKTRDLKVKNMTISKFQHFLAYIGGSMFQSTLDNPITSYRQLVQQYTKDTNGKMIDPSIARKDVNRVFLRSPISASLSGLTPRLFGATFKTIPKFGFLWGITSITGQHEPGILAAIGASIFSSYCINPVRMIEKQQRVELRTKGMIKSVNKILREAAKYGYRPLFRGTTPLIGHSAASAITGLVGQPKLQKYIQQQLQSEHRLSKTSANLVASALVSPIYVIMTNPLSRLEVIMQTNPIDKPSLTLKEAFSELSNDAKTFGVRGMFRGQGIGIVKAIISLTLFHEGRMMFEHLFSK